MQDATSLAKKILEIGKTQLLLKLRFLNHALWKLELVEIEEEMISTDGNMLYYQPYFILKQYREDQNTAMRIWLHSLMHCLFLHMFVEGVDSSLWDLACDIAVEGMIKDLRLDDYQSIDQRLREQELKKFATLVKPLTAEKIYRYLKDDPPTETLIKEWQILFAFDDHKIWYSKNKGGISSKKKSFRKNEEVEKSDEGEGGTQETFDSRSVWKHISQQIETELQTFSKQQGKKSGEFVKALKELHREHVDYRAFLSKFASRSEVMKTSLDEFDYIFYTYGLELYKDMPLIEPLEYREDKKIRDFVIVIDTSGSVQGDMIQMFLQKTFTILKQQETFDKTFHLHIIQCDSQVKRDDVITNQNEFDYYINNIQLHGFGGTDFRPAFEYVNELNHSGVFHDLKGLLYFTDGIGIYPKKIPDYLTTFVFVDSESIMYAKVPNWAIQILLEKEDLEVIQ